MQWWLLVHVSQRVLHKIVGYASFSCTIFTNTVLLFFAENLQKKVFPPPPPPGTSGPRCWNLPVLVNDWTATFLVYQYCLKMGYLCSLECASVIQKHTILECKNNLVLPNTCVLVSGTQSASRNLKGGIGSLFDPCVNAMWRRPYWPSRMELGYCTSGFGAICADHRYRVIHRAAYMRVLFKCTRERQLTLNEIAWQA